MAIDLDFGKIPHRIGAASACIATGVLATVTAGTAGTAGIVAGVLASVGGNILASDIHGHLARRLGRSREVFRNHDLTRAVGRAIGLAIEEAADDPRLKDAAKDLKSLARKAPAHWETLAPATATNESIAPLAESELVHFIGVKADDLDSTTALESDTWADLVGWMAELEKLHLRRGTVVLVAERLHRRFPSALREVLKHDFATDGRAYAGLGMLVWGELVGSIAELKQQSGELHADLREALDAILAEIITAITRLRAEAEGERRNMLDRMSDLVETLRGDLRGGQEQILAGINDILARLAALSEQLKGRTTDGPPEARAIATTPAPVAPVPAAAFPPPRNARFLPRRDRAGEDILDALHARPKAVRRVVLHGMPAVGKTQATLEYAHRYSEVRQHYSEVFWTNAETEDQLRAGVLGIGSRLGLAAGRPVDEILSAVKLELQRRDGWLWVLDNAQDARMAMSYLPAPQSGRVLITTTRPDHEWRALGGMSVELKHFHDHGEGARFLLTLSGLMGRDQALESTVADDVAAARALSEEVGGLPLALDQAAAYIENTGGSPREYLDQYRRRGEELRRLRTPLPEDDRDHANVTLTFGMIFERIEVENPATADLLRLLAFLAPSAVPEEIVISGAAFLGERLGPAVANDLPLTRMPALRARLLTRDQRTATLSVHRLVQDVLRDRMDDHDRKLWAERAVRVLNGAVPEVEWLDLDQINLTLAHLSACARWIKHYGLDLPEAGRLLDKTGCQLYFLARFDESLHMLDRALSITEAALGSDHPDTARTLNNKGILLEHRTEFDRAEELYRRSLSVRGARLGPAHSDTASTLNNLANPLQAKGDLSGAEPLHRRALEIYEEALGARPPQDSDQPQQSGVPVSGPGEGRRCRAALPSSLDNPEEGSWSGSYAYQRGTAQLSGNAAATGPTA